MAVSETVAAAAAVAPSPGSSAREPSKWRSRADSRRGMPDSCFTRRRVHMYVSPFFLSCSVLKQKTKKKRGRRRKKKEPVNNTNRNQTNAIKAKSNQIKSYANEIGARHVMFGRLYGAVQFTSSSRVVVTFA